MKVGPVNDPAEAEADRVADQVMRMPAPAAGALSPAVAVHPGSALVQRLCAECEEEAQRKPLDETVRRQEDDDEELIQTKEAPGSRASLTASAESAIFADGHIRRLCADCGEESEASLHRSAADSAAGETVPHIVHDVLHSGGRPLDATTRAFMEPRFGRDFSGVRVHADPKAAESAGAINARAYTVGCDIVFGAGQFAPGTRLGRQLIAHELTHVMQQQSGSDGTRVDRNDVGADKSPFRAEGRERRVMKKGFESTVEICHRVLETRKFEVENGGLKVVLIPRDLDQSIPNCRDFQFWVTLTRSEDWWPDDEIGTCNAPTGGVRSFSFANLPSGTYYLTIFRMFEHPYCCLEGDILVSDEPVSNDSSECRRDKDPSAMDIVHGALDIAGFIPVLGAIPDGINAGIYVVEGDWVNAGLSAVAMVPAWGDGVKLASVAGKSAIKITPKAALRLGEEGIAKGLKEVKAASKSAYAAEDTAKAATKIEGEAAAQLEKDAARLEKEAAEKALAKQITECEAIWAAYKALKCPSCKSTDTPTERAAKIACLTTLLAGRKLYLKNRCDYVLPGSIARGSAIAEKGHQTQVDQIAAMLLKCATLPTS